MFGGAFNLFFSVIFVVFGLHTRSVVICLYSGGH